VNPPRYDLLERHRIVKHLRVRNVLFFGAVITKRMGMESKRMGLERKWLWIVLATALLFRLGHFMMLHRDPVADIPVLDSWSYDRMARQIAFGDGMPRKVYFQAPFYPYFLAASYRLSGGSIDFVRLIQILLDALSAVLVFRITRRLFNLQAAILAGLGMAVYPVLIFQTGLLLKTTLNVFWSTLMLWLIFEPWHQWNGVRYGCLGLVSGWAAATQGSVLLQIPLVFLWIIVDGPWNRPGRWIRHGGYVVIGLILSIGPFTLRNYRVSGRWVLLTAQGGANFYLGNSPYSDGTSQRPPRIRMTPEYEEADFHREAERALGRTLTPEEASAYWTHQAFIWIREHPKDALRLQFRKLGLFWNRVEIPDNYDFDFYRRYSWFIRFPRFPFWIAGALGLTGMLLMRTTWRKTWFLYLWVFSYCGIWVMFHIYSRYRLPVVAFLMPFAAAVPGWFRLNWQQRRYARIAGAVIIVAMAAGAQALPLTHYTPAQPLFNLGSGLTRLGRLDAAAEAYHEALAVHPDYVPAMVNLGKLAWARGRQTDAVYWWESALSHDPDAVEAHSNLGTFYALAGEMRKAQTHFEHAVRIQPYYFLGWLHLAQARQSLNDAAGAENAFRSALALQPDHVQALYGLGMVLDTQGKTRDAVAVWTQYLHRARHVPEEQGYVREVEKRLNRLRSDIQVPDDGRPGGQPPQSIGKTP